MGGPRGLEVVRGFGSTIYRRDSGEIHWHGNVIWMYDNRQLGGALLLAAVYVSTIATSLSFSCLVAACSQGHPSSPRGWGRLGMVIKCHFV